MNCQQRSLIIRDHGDDVLVGCMHQLINKVWEDESMPDDWTISSICPIYKKGDPMSCKNYRGISLLNVAYKILSNVICERLKPFCNTLIGKYQCGFRPGRSTIDQIFTLRQILEKTNEFQSRLTIFSSTSKPHMIAFIAVSSTWRWPNSGSRPN